MPEVQCTPDRPCTAVQLLLQRLEVAEKMLDSMKNRLPPYVTAIGMAASLVVGSLATVVATLLAK